MNCRLVQELASGYLDRELNGQEMLEVRNHIHSCLPCQAEIESLRQLKSTLQLADDVPVPSGLEERILIRIHNQKPNRAPWAKSIALVCVSAAAGFVLFSGIGHMADRSNHSASVATNESVIASEIELNELHGDGEYSFGGSPVVQVSDAR